MSVSVKIKVLMGLLDGASLPLLAYILKLEGFDTIPAGDGDHLVNIANQHAPNVFLIDVSVAGESLGNLCLRLKANPLLRRIPTIYLADTNTQVAIPHFSEDTDRILDKPVPPEDLLANLEEALASARRTEPEQLRFGDLTIDLSAYEVYRNGRLLQLTPIEFRLLRHLMQHPRQVFTREQLAASAWPHRVHVGSRTVDVHIGRLRKSITQGAETDLIRTVRTVGYSLAD